MKIRSLNSFRLPSLRHLSKKQVVAGFFVSILAFSAIITTLGSLPAPAQNVTYNWVDLQTIAGSNGTRFMIRNTDWLDHETATHIFEQQNQNLGCPNPVPLGDGYYNNFINFTQWDPHNSAQNTRAWLHTRTRSTDPTNGTCNDVSTAITIGSANNASISFVWINSGVIRNITDHNEAPRGGLNTPVPAGDFVFDSGSGRYIATAGNSCKNYITLSGQAGGQPTSGVLFLQSVGSGGNCSQGGNVQIRLGSPSNYSLPPGTGGGGSGGTGGGSSATGPTTDSCESAAGDFGWIVCPLAGALDSVVSKIEDGIIELLAVDRLYNDRNSSLHAIWATMRNIALLMLIPIMLVMVIGTAMDFGPFDAYTVKKALPRMVAAVVFISLSWPIVTFFIDLSDVVGVGLLNLITTAGGVGNNVHLADVMAKTTGMSNTLFVSMIAGTAVTWAAGALHWGIILSIGISVALAFLLGYVVLLFRLLAVLMLLVFSPIAILAWIFPGNDKMWKFWFDGIVSLLLIFPIMTGLIAMGRVAAFIVSNMD